MTATPTPWVHYDDTPAAGKTGRHEIVAMGRTVARIYATKGLEAEDLANAARIVLCVNAHDELVRLLKWARISFRDDTDIARDIDAALASVRP